MVSMQQLQDLMESDGTVVDQDGGKIGRIGQIYLDDQTNEPEWVSASTGLFGSSESFVPLQDATITGDELAVKYPKDMVKDAPRIEADGNLSPSQEDELYSYYKVGYADTGKATLRKYVVTEDVHTTVPLSHEEVRVEREPITDQNRDGATSGAAFSEEEHEMTLHAEKPVVEKEAKPVERVRLEKEEVRDEAEINEQVRKERIETEGDVNGR